MENKDYEIEVEINFGEFRIRVKGRDLNTILARLKKIDIKDVNSIRKELKQRFGTQIQIHSIEEEIPESLTEFVKNINPKNNTDRAITCIYYLKCNKHMSLVNIDDVENVLREASLPLPKNINDVMNKLSKQALLSPAKEKKDNKKAWYITQTGMRYVASGLKLEERR